MEALDFISSGDGFGFEHGRQFERLRATPIFDPYSNDLIDEGWSNPTILVIPSAYLASGSSAISADAVRELLMTADQLVIDDPTVDVRVGDRIRLGDHEWSVTGRPSDDINPWSGWQPTLVVNIEEPTG